MQLHYETMIGNGRGILAKKKKSHISWLLSAEDNILTHDRTINTLPVSDSKFLSLEKEQLTLYLDVQLNLS